MGANERREERWEAPTCRIFKTQQLIQNERLKKTRDYWFKAVQDFYCSENIANEVTNLKSYLHRKFKDSNEKYGPNAKSTRIWVRSYKKAVSTFANFMT